MGTAQQYTFEPSDRFFQSFIIFVCFEIRSCTHFIMAASWKDSAPYTSLEALQFRESLLNTSAEEYKDKNKKCGNTMKPQRNQQTGIILLN